MVANSRSALSRAVSFVVGAVSSAAFSSLVVGSLLLTGPQAGAAALVYSDFDTRTAGSFDVVSTPTNDSDGALRMQTFDATSQGKVSVLFHNAGGTALGTLGDLNQLSADFYKASSPVTGAANQFAYRVNLGQSGGQALALVWENNYNGLATVPTDVWQTNFNLVNGNFWERGNAANFNGGSQAVPLSSWVGGHTESADGNGTPANTVVLNANTPVYGLEIAYGSGVGAFTGYVDNVQIGFGGGLPQAYVDNVQTPEPASLGLLGIGALALVRRRRQTR